MRSKIFGIVVLCLLMSAVNLYGQKTKHGKICGNPNIKCRTSEVVFEPFEIPFEIPKTYAVYSSESFYAVILQSKSASSPNCADAFSEDKRLKVQTLFTDNKVFAFKCDEFNTTYYTGVSNNVGFMAVYAGKTLAEAKAFLKKVDATGKFKGANIRKLRAEFNGT